MNWLDACDSVWLNKTYFKDEKRGKLVSAVMFNTGWTLDDPKPGMLVLAWMLNPLKSHHKDIEELEDYNLYFSIRTFQFDMHIFGVPFLKLFWAHFLLKKGARKNS